MKHAAVLSLWLISLLASGWVIWQSPPMSRDLTFFLPRDPGLADRILIDQMRSGLPSRLILIALDGTDETALASASAGLAARLRDNPLFERVDNGRTLVTEAEGRLIFGHRYLLSPAVTPERFGVESLRRCLQDRLSEMGSSAGLLTKHLLRNDPTGESLEIVNRFRGLAHPVERQGVWFSADGARALLIVRSRAPGFDLDAQGDTVRAIGQAFRELDKPRSMSLSLSGPGPFAVEMNRTITRDARNVSSLTLVVVSVFLWRVYRSVRFVLLTLLPLGCGALAGMAAVTLLFGSVHGIMLGFGSALIGFANDYPIHLFTHLTGREPAETSIRRVWPTIRLGVLTTVAGFGAMLFSGFPGLVELGVFSIVGLLAAGLVCRWVMPIILSGSIRIPDWPALFRVLDRAAGRRAWRRVPLLAGVIGAGNLLITTPLWDDDIAHLSPVAEASQRFDQDLRSELGAPELNRVILLVADSAEDVLQHSEALGVRLDDLVHQGVLRHYDFAARYLPSAKRQRLRQQALPSSDRLRADLRAAARGLPFASGAFDPFLQDVEQARRQAPLQASDLAGTGLASAIEPLLFRYEDQWVALVTLSDVMAPERLASAIAGEGVYFFDLRQESSRLVTRYRQETLAILGLGALAMVFLLRIGLGGWIASARVLVPMALALALTGTLMRIGAEGLSLFHLIALLLVMGLAMDYGLFFNRTPADDEEHRRTQLSLLVCTVTTIIAFGLLLVSGMPLLRAIGGTVALGAGSAFLLSAWLARPDRVAE